MKQISVLVFFMITTKFLVAQNNHSYTVQLQGTFLSNEYYPAIAFEKKLKNQDELKITIGGGIVASKTYYTKNFSYDTINKTSTYTQYFTLPYGGTLNYNYPEYGQESKSLYLGFILKADYLFKIFYKVKGYKFSSLAFGPDVGLYLLNDRYKLIVENYITQQQRIVQGAFNSRALSIGGILDFKKSINTDLFKSFHNNLFIDVFAQFMFYFDYFPYTNSNYSSIYGGVSPFALWKYELGIGIGYKFYK